jgi:hypothetical protein
MTFLEVGRDKNGRFTFVFRTEGVVALIATALLALFVVLVVPR